MGKEEPPPAVYCIAGGGSQVIQLAFTQNKTLVLPTPSRQAGRAERLPGATPSSYCCHRRQLSAHVWNGCHPAWIQTHDSASTISPNRFRAYSPALPLSRLMHWCHPMQRESFPR